MPEILQLTHRINKYPHGPSVVVLIQQCTHCNSCVTWSRFIVLNDIWYKYVCTSVLACGKMLWNKRTCQRNTVRSRDSYRNIKTQFSYATKTKTKGDTLVYPMTFIVYTRQHSHVSHVAFPTEILHALHSKLLPITSHVFSKFRGSGRPFVINVTPISDNGNGSTERTVFLF